jgi:hypothetical protein
MANYFEIVAENLVKLGIHQYLFPFILLTALVFALLRKSKLLGESSAVNGVVAIVVSFMIVFGMPVAVGLRFATSLSVFLMQVSVFLIIFFVGFLVASLFYPNMMDWLPKVFMSRSMLMVAITLAIVFFITSGMVGVIFTTTPTPGQPTLPTDLTVFIVGIFLFITFILIASAAAREMKK